MRTRAWLFTVVTVVAVAIAMPAMALKIDKALKKLPDADREMITALMVFMDEDEIESYFELEDSAARESYLTETGYMRKWERIREDYRPHVLRREVVEGMNRDELWMTWGRPVQIRQTFYEKAYVDIFTFFFYEDRKGVAIPTPDRDDPKSYNRPQWEMNVYFHNGRVVQILEQGELFSPQELSDNHAVLPDALEPPPEAAVEEEEEESAEGEEGSEEATEEEAAE
jgi:hypothetical protein